MTCHYVCCEKCIYALQLSVTEIQKGIYNQRECYKNAKGESAETCTQRETMEKVMYGKRKVILTVMILPDNVVSAPATSSCVIYVSRVSSPFLQCFNEGSLDEERGKR